MDVDDMSEEELVESDSYFAVVPEWILFHREVQATDKVVWAVLQRFANANKKCWPGFEAIAEKSGISIRQVSRSILRLEEAGMIQVIRRKKWVESDGKRKYVNGSNIYTLRFVEPGRQRDNELRDVTFVPEDHSANLADDQSANLADRSSDLSAKLALETEPPDTPISKGNLVTDVVPVSQGGAAALRAPRAASRARKPKKPEPQRADVEQLCDTLVDYMVFNGLDRKQIRITETWRREARLLLDKDNVPMSEALETLEWCQRDQFWKKNVVSMPTFRKQYLRLRASAIADRKPQTTSRGDYWRKMADQMEAIDNKRDVVLELGHGDDTV